MFHCNGWCFPWTVAMLAGTQVCLRKVRVAQFRRHARACCGHYCAAPIVHNLLSMRKPRCRWSHAAGARHGGSAAPPAAMIEAWRGSVSSSPRDGLTEPTVRRRSLPSVAMGRGEPVGADPANGRQGVRYVLQEGMTVLDPHTMAEGSGRRHRPR